ncbi:hypothetical protein [Sulfurimonas sp.]
MRLFIITLMLLTLTLNLEAMQTTNSKYDARLCKVFQTKILNYEKNMRDDAYAKTTLESYKKRAKIFCTK